VCDHTKLATSISNERGLKNRTDASHRSPSTQHTSESKHQQITAHSSAPHACITERQLNTLSQQQCQLLQKDWAMYSLCYMQLKSCQLLHKITKLHS